MTSKTTTCPRCFHAAELPADANFCPRCGLNGLCLSSNAGPRQMMAVGNVSIRVGRRLAIGDACNLYDCTVGSARSEQPGVFKIARDAAGDGGLLSATAKLNRLNNGDAQLQPFLPKILQTLNYRAEGEAVGRQAVVMGYHEAIATPEALYSLEEVQAHYRTGIDARDMAWIWRRLLAALLLVHGQGVRHSAVTPAHILIEPNDHKLVLVGWGAAASGAGQRLPYRDWFDGEIAGSALTDLKTAARSMLAIMAQHLPQPPAVEPALLRYFDRCITASPNTATDKLLEDFDRLIETLWGPRRFRPFAMPPR